MATAGTRNANAAGNANTNLNANAGAVVDESLFTQLTTEIILTQERREETMQGTLTLF